MLRSIPLGSQLEREIQLAEEEEQRISSRLKADLVKMTSEKPDAQASTPKKPTPTPETTAPTEAQKTPLIPTPRTNTSTPMKTPTKQKTANKDKTPAKGKTAGKDADEQTPKKDPRIGLNKRLSEAWSDEALSLFADASDNFVRQLLKLKDLPRDQVLNKVSEVRETRIAAVRDAGKNVLSQWLPVDVENAAEALNVSIATAKRTGKRTASPSPTQSTVSEDNRSKKRKTSEPAVKQPAPLATTHAEPKLKKELPPVPDDAWESMVDFEPPVLASGQPSFLGNTPQQAEQIQPENNDRDNNDRDNNVAGGAEVDMSGQLFHHEMAPQPNQLVHAERTQHRGDRPATAGSSNH